MRKSNYDKRPVLHVRTKGVSAWQGWEAIGAQLRKAIVGKPDAVVAWTAITACGNRTC